MKSKETAAQQPSKNTNSGETKKLTETITKTIIEDVNGEKAKFSVYADSPIPVTVSEPIEVDTLRPRFRTELVNMQPGREGYVSTVHLRAVPRRGESIEYTCERTGEAKLFRVMDVVHTQDGLRMHGHIAKGLMPSAL